MLGALTQVITYVVPFLLVLTAIVTIHELGHFSVARAFGVKIDRFAIGFGRAVFRRVDRAHHVAQPILLADLLPRHQCQRVHFLGLLDDRAVQRQHQRAVLDRRRARPRIQRREQQRKEQQHRDEHERVLDADQQFPRAANQFHSEFLPCRRLL